MQRQFKEALDSLNSQQLLAVKTIDGPVLVIAGPGTGKTQLISTRVGYILQKTDTPADAILLLTFTEAGVQAMRERLNQLIGTPAYNVRLSTYHAFGGEIFRAYPDYFEDAQLSLVEELGSDSLLREIIAKLPYSNPLKFADNYINDLKTFISECKRALLSPADIDRITSNNLDLINKINKNANKLLNKLSVVSKSTVPIFEEILVFLSSQISEDLPQSVMPLTRYAQGELEQALEYFQRTAKTTLLTEWKRHWLAKDMDGNYIIDGARLNERLKAAAGIYKQYQQLLDSKKLYDYDDMILLAIKGLENNPELRYSLAERYNYIMLDEFQDTNPAQFKLVQLLTDHPVHEGRPNVLAVGDDDQAIYAFQGADHANMASFVKYYKDVKIIGLKENYRSWPQILQASHNISSQIQSRLINELPGVKKALTASKKSKAGAPLIIARDFKSDAAQYNWVADEINKLIKKGMPASEIAVIAPKHRYLIPLLPYLAQYKLRVRYERRENILDEPLIHQLEQMSRLVLALADGDERQSNHLWPEILSYGFWQIPTEKIWRLSWQSRQSHESWTSIMLNDEHLKSIASFFIALSTSLEVLSLEEHIDILLGVPGSREDSKLPLKSPMYDFYFSKENSQIRAMDFSKLISDLNILRSRLREWYLNMDQRLGLRALVEFIEGHRAAGINILNTSPYLESREAINILTAYGAKSREFEAVFIIAAIDEVWGSASRNQGSRLSLPANLSYIRYQGASEDERLRLLYVAATRARSRLYLMSYSHDLAGKLMTRLKYLEIEMDDRGRLISKVLPAKFNEIITDSSENIDLVATLNYWQQRHAPPLKPSLNEVLKPRLKTYQLSPTDLNHFVNIVKYGPDAFFMKCLLQFPSAPTVTDSFGTALHNTLRFAGRILKNEDRLPDEERLIEIYQAQLSRIELPPSEFENLSARGRDSIHAWLKQYGQELEPNDKFEYNFQNEGSKIDEVRLNGKVDRIVIDEKRRSIIVMDYKTGRAYSRWQTGVIKLHFYRQQLVFYKLLIENSARFKRYKVERGIIEFIEPNQEGKLSRLELEYADEQIKDTVKLIKAVWHHVQSLKFPDISAYQPSLTGIRKFEEDLIKSNTS